LFIHNKAVGLWIVYGDYRLFAGNLEGKTAEAGFDAFLAVLAK